MLFFPLSELVKRAGAWRRCKRRTRWTLSDKKGSTDDADLFSCVPLVSLSPCLLSHLPPSVSVGSLWNTARFPQPFSHCSAYPSPLCSIASFIILNRNQRSWSLWVTLFDYLISVAKAPSRHVRFFETKRLNEVKWVRRVTARVQEFWILLALQFLARHTCELRLLWRLQELCPKLLAVLATQLKGQSVGATGFC